MTQGQVVDLIRYTLTTTFWLSLPLLALGFVVGAFMGLVQILTSMQDSAFGTVPRLVAFLVGLFFFLPWMVVRLTTFATSLFGDLSRYAH